MRKAWKIVLCMGLVTVAGVSFWLRDVIEACWIHDSEFAAAVSEGAMITPAMLRAKYSAPDNENAAPLIRELIKRWHDQPKSDQAAFSQLTGKLVRQRAENMAMSLASYSPPIEKAEAVLSGYEALLQKPRCDFKRKWEDSWALAFPELADFKALATVAAVRGRILASEAKPLEVAKKFEISLHIARLAGDEPALISKLVQVACEVVAENQIAQALAENPNDAELRTAVRKVLAKWSGPIDLAAAMDAELMSQRLGVYEIATDKAIDATDLNSFRSQLWIPGMRRAWQTRAVQSMRRANQVYSRVQRDPILILGAMSALDIASEESQGYSYSLANLYAPVYGGAGTAMLRQWVTHDLLIVALDLLDERQKLGRWPDTLSGEPRDMFSGKPIRYEVKEGTATIWSVGPDRKDSQGKLSVDHTQDDIAFRFPMPKSN